MQLCPFLFYNKQPEVMNILKLTENDVIKDSISFITKNECDILGFKKNVKFIFGTYDALISIVTEFDEKELNKIEKEITRRLGQGKYSYRYGKDFLDKILSNVSWVV